MSTATQYDPLVQGAGLSEVDETRAESSRFWCGACEKLLFWRGEGSNRLAWKTICSVVLCAELGLYFFVVRELPFLFLIGLVSMTKYLVEIWGQDTPTWICPGGLLMFFVCYTAIVPVFVYGYGLCGLHPDINHWFDLPFTRDHISPAFLRNICGTLLFFVGSSFSLSYEVGRFNWKARPENKGKLHTVGLARYSIHPNYFGDLLTYTGWALVSGTGCALSIPALQPFAFMLLVIPNSDAYLANRYCKGSPTFTGGTTFAEYSARTAALIPGVKAKWANWLLAVAALVCGVSVSLSCTRECASLGETGLW